MAEEKITIRMASIKDAEALRNIYTPYVRDTSVTLECDVPSLEDFAQRIAGTLISYPYLAALRGGQIVGYAYASPFRARSAYMWSAESSIYVDQSFRHQGIGHRLYSKLESLLKAQNITCVCACVTSPNTDSLAFHKRQGFTQAGIFRNCAYKLGKWRDVIWMQKFLTDFSDPPEPFIPFSSL